MFSIETNLAPLKKRSFFLVVAQTRTSDVIGPAVLADRLQLPDSDRGQLAVSDLSPDGLLGESELVRDLGHAKKALG
jgi:hypothetical protein